MTDAPFAEPDEVRRRALVRMKLIAAGLLLFAGLVWLVCVLIGDGAGAWVGYVKAAAEASMVGALADWFAVTALFRHPLGIPIPHTAIIPRKKDQIGASLGEFVQTNFLSGPVLGEKLRQIGVTRRIGEWLASPENAHRLGDNMGAAINGLTEVLSDDDVQAAVDQLVIGRLKETPAAPLLAQVLQIAVEGNHHQQLLTSGLGAISKFLDDNRDILRDKLGEESPDWVPVWVDERLFNRIFSGVQSFIGEVRAESRHELRHQFDVKILDYVERLRTDPPTAERVEAVKTELLNHPAVQQWSSTLWAGLKRNLVELSNDPNSELRKRVESAIMHLGQKLRDDEQVRSKVDRWLERTLLYVVEQYKDDIADLISGTVARWDTDETSRRIELQVGRDLQFIRINGTVVGGLAGLLIYTVAQLIG